MNTPFTIVEKMSNRGWLILRGKQLKIKQSMMIDTEEKEVSR